MPAGSMGHRREANPGRRNSKGFRSHDLHESAITGITINGTLDGRVEECVLKLPKLASLAYDLRVLIGIPYDLWTLRVPRVSSCGILRLSVGDHFEELFRIILFAKCAI